jgi:FlaA1/EpsC-like NDP-sugar epimerase
MGRINSQRIYTSPVIPPLKNLNWHSFLARPPLPPPPPEVLDALGQQPSLITGAGGSIGSALTMRLAALTPPMLLLLESSESHLYNFDRQWTEAGAPGPMTAVLGDVSDRALLDEVFSTHAPRIVFHAAAFKHVPLMEAHPLAAMANNIFGTETLVRAAATHGARVVLLSTDKAVDPTSVMGATKRVAEQIVLNAGGTVLRLGNVLASRDSVAEVFARQIALGGPVTVTDPSARRYFLTLDEAVNLLLTAAVHPERSALLAPALPAAHHITELAQFLARELAPNREIAIEFTGLRPGDKETELLWTEGEPTSPVLPGALVSIQSSVLPNERLTRSLASLHAALASRDLAAALTLLRTLVPGYNPSPAVLACTRQRALEVSR